MRIDKICMNKKFTESLLIERLAPESILEPRENMLSFTGILEVFSKSWFCFGHFYQNINMQKCQIFTMNQKAI